MALKQSKSWVGDRLFLRELLAQFLLYALPIGLATAITVYFFYHLDVNMSEEDIHHTEQHHLALRHDLLAEKLLAVASDLRVLREMVAAHSDDEGSPVQDVDLEEAVEHFEIYCREFRRYQGFRVLREDGAEVAQVHCNEGRPLVKRLIAATENLRLRPWTGLLGLDIGEVWISPLTVGAARGSAGDWFQAQVAFASLLAAESDRARYFVVALLSMRTLITELLIDTGEGGTMLLVDRSGTVVGRPKEGVPAGNAQWWGINFNSLYPEVWDRLWLEEAGEVESQNGLFSFNTLRPVQLLRNYQAAVEGYYPRPEPGANARQEPIWKLVSHVPRSELVAGRERFAQKFTLLAPILLVIPLLGSWYLAQHTVRRRQAVRELAENERYLRQIVDNVLDGIVTTDGSGGIEQSNAAVARLFKLSPGSKCSSVYQLIPRAELPVPIEDSEVFSELEIPPLRLELELPSADGSRFPAELVVMHSQMGGQSRLIWVIRDITERRELERKKESERLRFFHQIKMAEVGMLAAGIIHEVGNPIAAIQGLVEDLQRRSAGGGQWDEPMRGNLGMVLEQARRLGGITRDISEYVRYRPGVEGLFDINSVVRSTARLVRYDARWKSISLELDLDASIPALRGVEDQITQVIMNLLVNAADAMQTNGPGERRVLIASRYSGSQVELTIEDNGSGMSDEIRAHVFESFYTTKPEGKGTGLGLALCKSIVESHGGIIEVESTAGTGSRFRVVLPVASVSRARSA